MEEDGSQPQPRPKRMRRIVARTLVIGVVCLLVGTTLVWAGLKIRTPHPPKELTAAQKTVAFPLFYARKLPEGFSFDAKSVSTTRDVALYWYSYDNDKKRLIMSVQPLASSFDASLLKATDKFTTTIGTAYMLDFDDRTGAVVMGDKSWIVLNAPDRVASDTLRHFLDALRPVND